ncbi:MAG: SDR family oxidoreductase [Chloroflexota bacterium]|nr:SDR family oxidoreductase [Chloroflexota bacterium]MDE2910205.1 SDR family oxidoreductase [Chloroflexota bacterium]
MIQELFSLEGRVALVTGAAQGMGRAMALALADAGADLLIADIKADGLSATADEIAALGRRALPVNCDVTSIEQIRAMFARLDRDYGRIDILGNVAGPGKLGAPEDIDLALMADVVLGLTVARFCCCQEAGRRMLAAGAGSIINICSIGGVSALGRGNFPYSVGMGGVAQMTRELSTEWSSRGVRVNAILPAQVINPGLVERMEADDQLEAQFLSGIPIGRLGQPQDIAGLAVFLASDASSWITGALIPFDGGNLALNAGGTPGSLPGVKC